MAGHDVVGHGGSHVGATAELLLVEDRNLVIAVVANANSSSLGRRTREALTVLLEAR